MEIIENKKGIYQVVFEYEEPRSGKYAAEAAVRIAEALIQGEKYDLQSDIDRLKQMGP